MNEQDERPEIELEISAAGDTEILADLTVSLQPLVEVAARQGRDWKLIGALLQLIVDMVTETDGDVFETPVGSTSSRNTPEENTVDGGRSHGKLLPEFQTRIACVIDSWSDDETANYLRVGLRQVRRLAHRGDLYYFLVGRKRRYPVWQFGSGPTRLSGTRELAAIIPRGWDPHVVYEFMTTRSSELREATPAQWLLIDRDLLPISHAVEAFRASGSQAE